MKLLSKFSLAIVSLGLFLAFSLSPAFADDSYSFNLGFYAQTGAETGSVQLAWADLPNVGNYNIAYGTAPGSYVYGVTNTGKTNNFVVRGLTPGQKYYFVISPVVDGRGTRFSPETSAVAATTTTSAPTGPVSQASLSVQLGGPTQDAYHLRAVPGGSAGEVLLTWDNPWRADSFHVVYGPQSGGFTWGALNVGRDNSNHVVIKGLTPGWKYAFAVVANPNTTPQAGLSMPVAQAAK